MSETKHTPTPWACDYEDQDHTGIGIADDEMLIALVAPKGGPDELDKANAEFICLAVNCHDELVGMVECAIAAMDGEWGGDSQIVQRFIAQLAKIKA